MPTNGEVYQQLKNVETGFSMPDAENSGQQRILYLPDFVSILSFKHLPSNDKVVADIKRQGESMKVVPNNAIDYAHVDLRVDTSVFTDPAQADLPFKSDYMFVGLNSAARKKSEYSDGDWGQFHDMEFKTPTFNLAFMTNDDRFRGSYITDILKNAVDSNSGSVEKAYFVKQESRQPGMFLDENNVHDLAAKLDGENIAEAEQVIRERQEKYRKSASLFIKECQIIQPKRLIVLGDKAQTIVRNMRAAGLFDTAPEVAQLADNLIESQHYSKQGKGSSTVDFMAYLQTLLKKTEDDVVNS